MQLTSLLLVAAGATVTSAMAVESRLPRLGAFGVSTTSVCPLVNLETSEFAVGAQSDACRTFYDNTTYQAIDVFYWIPQCLLTLYNTPDCEDTVGFS